MYMNFQIFLYIIFIITILKATTLTFCKCCTYENQIIVFIDKNILAKYQGHASQKNNFIPLMSLGPFDIVQQIPM